ncbi:MAG: class I SAM-dependent methyltransferase [Chitinophagaceae bacterium]|nr:class I SAM-dependent methyltransferase [Chitinophagaceae bacterium]
MKQIIKNYIWIVDFFLFPLVLLASLLLKLVRKAGIQHMPYSKAIFFKVGVYPILDHYYEPKYKFSDLKKPINQPRKLSGINWNDKAQLELIGNFKYSNEITYLGLKNNNSLQYYFNNNSFDSGDAEYFYNAIRFFKPKRIIEIGSGHSTKLARIAIEKNYETTNGYHCQHICIEPYEMPWLENLGIEIIRKKVEDVPLEIFHQLEENDILFIDSSHMIRPQGDVLTEIFEILPILNKGVIVHVHDIFSPRDYIEEWLKNDIKFWNEQYLLEAFLMNNEEWQIIGALNYLHHKYFENFNKICLFHSSERNPGSFYIKKMK